MAEPGATPRELVCLDIPGAEGAISLPALRRAFSAMSGPAF